MLLPLVEVEAVRGDREPVVGKALSAISEAQPLTVNVVKRCLKFLDHPHPAIASSALVMLIGLPPKRRSRWVPLLLEQLRCRFSDGSEATWIIECLAPHFTSHCEQIVPALRALRVALKSDDPFLPHSALMLLRQLGIVAKEMVPEVLAYIGRQTSFTNEEPHLIHLDPKGKDAIPGLIRLLSASEETARYQAVSELEAYGPIAQSAIPALTKLARRKRGNKVTPDMDAAQRVVEKIKKSSPAVESQSATERVLKLLEKVVAEE